MSETNILDEDDEIPELEDMSTEINKIKQIETSVRLSKKEKERQEQDYTLAAEELQKKNLEAQDQLDKKMAEALLNRNEQRREDVRREEIQVVRAKKESRQS